MKILVPLLTLLLLLPACSSRVPPPFRHDNAAGYYTAKPEQCVPYARRVSGLELYGNANDWWAKAAGKYDRGNTPRPGAVLVLKSTNRMRAGHVAVVKGVLNRRQMNVTHSNWGSDKKSRSIVYESQLVEDVSGGNDWTQVRFWNDEKGVLGFPYAAYGFIYP